MANADGDRQQYEHRKCPPQHDCINLSRTLETIHSQVKEALPLSKEGQLHDIQPGDWIVVKDHRRRAWTSPRWLGAFQVLLITSSALKVAERATWIHNSHCKWAPPLDTNVTIDQTVQGPD